MRGTCRYVINYPISYACAWRFLPTTMGRKIWTRHRGSPRRVDVRRNHMLTLVTQLQAAASIELNILFSPWGSPYRERWHHHLTFGIKLVNSPRDITASPFLLPAADSSCSHRDEAQIIRRSAVTNTALPKGETYLHAVGAMESPSCTGPRLPTSISKQRGEWRTRVWYRVREQTLRHRNRHPPTIRCVTKVPF